MEAKIIYAYWHVWRHGEYYIGITPGSDKELQIPTKGDLDALQAHGFNIVVCATREEAQARSRGDNKQVDSPLIPKEDINNLNREGLANLNINAKNNASFNINVGGRDYLKTLPRFADGRRNFGKWAVDRMAYRLKFKCFYVLKISEEAGQPAMDGTFLALNAGCSLTVVMASLPKWVRSGHIIQHPFSPPAGTNKTYRLGRKGEHMLAKIEASQPAWAAARHLELSEWLGEMGKRLSELGANNRSAHQILKESALEDWHQPKRKPSPAKALKVSCPRCGRALHPYQGRMACLPCGVFVRGADGS